MNSVDAVAVLALERKVEIGARRVAQRRAADVADARRRSPPCCRPALMRLPTGFSPGKKRCGERVADDHDRRASMRVARVEQPSGAQRNLERAEIAARRRLPAHFRRPLPRARSDAPGRTSGAVQLLPVSGVTAAAPTVSTSGERFDRGEDARCRARRARAARRSGRPASPICTVNTPSAVKPGSTAIRLAKLRSVRPGADQQHDRERDLRRDQRRCRAARAGASS